MSAGDSSQKKSWEQAAQSFKSDLLVFRELEQRFQLEFEDVLHDYKRYLESVQLAFKFRWDKLVELVTCERTLEAKKVFGLVCFAFCLSTLCQGGCKAGHGRH